MNKNSLKKPVMLSSLTILLVISIPVSSNSLSYAFLPFELGSSDSQDQSLTSTQSSSQGSYCYAPPNATIINSCNSGDLSSSENTGLNLYE